jgi:signal peptidase I
MPLKHIILHRLLLSIYLLIGLLIPGSSLLLANKNKWAFVIPLLGVMWVSLLSWTRWVITPTGFMVMLVGLLALHVFSYALGLKIGIKQVDITPNLKTWGTFVLLCLLNIGVVVSCHLYKDKWFGFTFYHIPSDSMYPTFETGDVMFADTWVYHDTSPQTGEVVIFIKDDRLFTKRIFAIENDHVLLKGIEPIKSVEPSDATSLAIEHNKVFVLGDNQIESRDSRHYGPIAINNIVAKSMYKLFSVNNERLDFKVFGDRL